MTGRVQISHSFNLSKLIIVTIKEKLTIFRLMCKKSINRYKITKIPKIINNKPLVMEDKS